MPHACQSRPSPPSNSNCDQSSITHSWNDLIVPDRQKHKGTNWSWEGPVALVALKCLKFNNEYRFRHKFHVSIFNWFGWTANRVRPVRSGRFCSSDCTACGFREGPVPIHRTRKAFSLWSGGFVRVREASCLNDMVCPFPFSFRKRAGERFFGVPGEDSTVGSYYADQLVFYI